MHKNRNRGLSLLEVILALAILGVSMSAISQLFFLGARSASQATLRNEANILADTKMAELVSGILEPQSTGQSGIAEAPGWVYSVKIDDGNQPGLKIATVIVQTVGDRVPVSLSITRFISSELVEEQ
ncbi:prepilin-type N-terminal cleavage/methylation domain-containing protein [Mariniblastus sp.]|nr:prepilin-type N-terminal cleavage/methylation domain-containing protein [Mariniblastus sp.]